MRCDGRTFTATNGSVVSGRADRAVNRGPNTEQINISKNSSAFSDRLCARQRIHQALSCGFSLQMWQGDVRGPPPSSPLNSDHRAGPARQVLPSPGQSRQHRHEISFGKSSAELTGLMMLPPPAANTDMALIASLCMWSTTSWTHDT